MTDKPSFAEIELRLQEASQALADKTGALAVSIAVTIDAERGYNTHTDASGELIHILRNIYAQLSAFITQSPEIPPDAAASLEGALELIYQVLREANSPPASTH